MGERVAVGFSSAEREIRRWPTDTPEGIKVWAKHVVGAEVKHHQAVWVWLIRLFRNVLGVDSPRVGKSWSFSMANLMDCAEHHSEDLRIYTPAKHQAKNNLGEILKHIERPLPQGGHNPLWHFIRRRGGKRQLLAESFEFENSSNGKIFGERSQIDSENATILHLDEVDDMNPEIVRSRIMTRGLAANPNGLPTRVRYTGVIQGRENLHAIETAPNSFQLPWPGESWEGWARRVAALYEEREPKNYKAAVLPKLTLPVAIEIGIIDRHAAEALIETLSHEETQRLVHCLYVEARNFFHEAWLRQMFKAGQAMEPPLAMIDPTAGGRHEKVGRTALGLDASGQGQGEDASKYACVVVEQVGPVRFLRYAQEWAATANTDTVVGGVAAIWDFFRPSVARGDAFGAHLVRKAGERLAEEGLTGKNPRLWPEDTEANWKRWPIVPTRFTGFEKHLMFDGLRTALEAGLYAAPYAPHRFESRKDFREPVKGGRALAKAAAQAANIRSRAAKTYNSYQMIQKFKGDDILDAWALADSALGRTKHAEVSLRWL